MKIITYILSLIVLALSVYSDCEHNISDYSETKTHSCDLSDVNSNSNKDNTSHNHNNNESHDHDDFCSPFCVDDCCSNPMTLSISSIVITNIKDNPIISYISYSDLYNFTVVNSFLQPPRHS